MIYNGSDENIVKSKIIVIFSYLKNLKVDSGTNWILQFLDHRHLTGKLCLWIKFLKAEFIIYSLLALTIGKKNAYILSF